MEHIEGWYENHPSLEYDRRALSGIYIFEKYPEEERVEPTCFEDCSPMRQEEYIKSLQLEKLQELTLVLSRALKDVGKDLNLEAEPPDIGDNTDEEIDEIPQG